MSQINGKLRYLLSLLFLHGVDQRGNDVELLKSSGFPQNLQHITEIPFIAVSPQCLYGLSWDMVTDAIMALLDEIISAYPVDPKRVYLTGASMGGYGAWDVAI